MKKYYEVALMQHVKGSVEDDYETVHFTGEGCNYRKCKVIAKEMSMHLGETNVDGFSFHETQPRKEFYHQGLDEGLAAVKIVCYTENEYTSYEPLYYEYYRNGKVDYKIDFNYE